MSQNNRLHQYADVNVGLKVDPRVVLSGRLLQCSSQELEAAIDSELVENPALERLEEDDEPVDEQSILRSIAPQELVPGSEDVEFKRSLPQDDFVDWVDLAADSNSLWDHLRAQMEPHLTDELREVGEYLIDAVNDKGYLTVNLEEAALATGCSLECAERALRLLQSCEPRGVGASCLQECLLLQLVNVSTLEGKLARQIVKRHMDEFAARRTITIARKYHVMPEIVESAYDEILGCTPYPGEEFSAAPSRTGGRSSGVSPDLVLNRDERGWSIEVRGAEPSCLTVNREYRIWNDRLQTSSRADKTEKRHVAAYVQRAKDFIHALGQRKRTLASVGEYLVNHQAGFVSTGDYGFLHPLTRSQMASDLGVHESTVSRATSGKYVQLSNGEVVSFDVFFKPALRVQKMIEEILQTENPANPLSDERIAAMLADKGVKVARRTVNKYRDRTRLLSSRRRRSA